MCKRFPEKGGGYTLNMKKFVQNPETALIFNIQKFCLHDGPGIRTTVFFNGCPLRCPWCSNPESLLLEPRLMYNSRFCALCGKCGQVCPTSAIKVSQKGWTINRDLCNLCGLCAQVCPNDAIEISGKLYNMEQVVDEVLKDKAFYDKSGGGVTFSGGEVLLQVDFATRLASLLQRKGIHVACETTASVQPLVFNKLLEVMDYYLLDMKHYDPEKLQTVCNGNYNFIRENTIAVVKSNKTIVGRIPIIPGFNNTLEDAKGFAEYASEVGIKEIHLLPFHQFGESKYEQLSIEYSMKDYKELHNEDIEDYAKYLIQQGFKVQIGG